MHNMAVTRSRKKAKVAGRATTRVSVSVRNNSYGVLQELAERKRVSVAWVIRDAIDQYIEAQAPLFAAGD